MNKQNKARPKKNFGPAIFYFQPTAYKWAEASQLREWEEAMAKLVGIAPYPEQDSRFSKRPRRPKMRMGKSFFKCGGAEWDGCDTG
jgi:hypothetical protein